MNDTCQIVMDDLVVFGMPRRKRVGGANPSMCTNRVMYGTFPVSYTKLTVK